MKKITLAVLLTSGFAVNATTPDSTVTIDFAVTGGQSFELQGDAANQSDSCIRGGSITGVSFDNIMIQTEGVSWTQELSIRIQNSDGSQNYTFQPGAGVGNGTDPAGPFSQAIHDFTDNAETDIAALGDAELQIELHEVDWNDVDPGMDSFIISGTVTYHGIGISMAASCSLPVELQNFSID